MTSRILRHVSSRTYTPEQERKLARSIGVERREYGAFREAVRELMRAGHVMRGSGDCVMLPDATQRIIGVFRGHPRGFGFLVPEAPTDYGDLFIPPGASMKAITGDTVAARITRRRRNGRGGRPSGGGERVEGEVVEIITRGQSRFVGELLREGRQWYMRADGHALHQPVLLDDVGATRARAGDQVVVEITSFPGEEQPARGAIVEVLGRRSDPGVDILSIIRQYQFPEEFPPEVLEDARRAIREHDLEAELQRREDLRGEVLATIDPDDAKDYDDAISIRRVSRREGGGFELGVHIADVSAFVHPGRPLDDEACRRGNSIYFPRYVIPMLPPVLSNGLCSLQEDQPRLTKSAFIRYDRTGRRVSARMANTVIQSARRLTYRQATAILEGEAADENPKVVQLLKDMEHLARLIQKRRKAAGMIVLELPEVDLVLDDEDQVVDVKPADTSFSHTIIEMFMVEANEAVAERMSELGVPHLRRIHPEPPPDAQQKLTRFLRVLGEQAPERLERQDVIHMLDRVRGKPTSFAVNLGVLRSMAQAEYSPKMIGHYALASEHYSHFTSPIRRYPDLVLHRLLDMDVAGELTRRRGRQSIPSADTLTRIGRRCSYSERRAEDAERELNQLKILRFLEKRLGDIEEGVVTGVTNVGVFVQLRKYLIDGLIQFPNMPDDWWEIDTRTGSVVGQRSGRRIRIGDLLRVQLAAVDLAIRRLDLAWADEPGEKGKGKKEKGPKLQEDSGESRKKEKGEREKAQGFKKTAVSQKKGKSPRHQKDGTEPLYLLSFYFSRCG